MRAWSTVFFLIPSMDGVIYWMGFLLKVVLLIALLRYLIRQRGRGLCADMFNIAQVGSMGVVLVDKTILWCGS